MWPTRGVDKRDVSDAAASFVTASPASSSPPPPPRSLYIYIYIYFHLYFFPLLLLSETFSPFGRGLVANGGHRVAIDCDPVTSAVNYNFITHNVPMIQFQLFHPPPPSPPPWWLLFDDPSSIWQQPLQKISYSNFNKFDWIPPIFNPSVVTLVVKKTNKPTNPQNRSMGSMRSSVRLAPPRHVTPGGGAGSVTSPVQLKPATGSTSTRPNWWTNSTELDGELQQCKKKRKTVE